MANKRNFWVVGSKTGWAVKREGASRVTSTYRTKAEAWNAAKAHARESHGEAILQGASGRIRERDSYGDEPAGTRR